MQSAFSFGNLDIAKILSLVELTIRLPDDKISVYHSCILKAFVHDRLNLTETAIVVFE